MSMHRYLVYPDFGQFSSRFSSLESARLSLLLSGGLGNGSKKRTTDKYYYKN